MEVDGAAEAPPSEVKDEAEAPPSDDAKPPDAAPPKPAPARRPFNGARVLVLHEGGHWYGGFLSFLENEGENKGKWHVVFEDDEEGFVELNQECTLVSVKEAAPADGVCLSHGMLRIKRDMLDMCGAMPSQDTIWWARRRHVWEADVRNARSLEQLNVLLLEFGRCMKHEFIEQWWCPWDGFRLQNDSAPQVTSRRCRYTEGGSIWRCKCAAIPGKSVCKRHLKKQLASAGMQGFKVKLRPSDQPEALKLVKPEPGMMVEVLCKDENGEEDWWTAIVTKVNRKGMPQVAYPNDEDDGLVTKNSELQWVEKKRLRLPVVEGEGAKGEDGKEGGGEELEGDFDEDEGEEKDLIMANEDAVTSSAVLLRIHSLDQALRYADELKPEPPAPKETRKKKKKK